MTGMARLSGAGKFWPLDNIAQALHLARHLPDANEKKTREE